MSSKKLSVRQMRGIIARRPLGSVWSQIRNTPRAGMLEETYVLRRNRPGTLIPNSISRSKILVFPKPRVHARSELHTHIKHDILSSGFPSPADVSYFLADTAHSKIRFWHIATVSKKGTPMGLVTVHATPRFVAWVRRYPEKVRVIKRLLAVHQENKETPTALFRNEYDILTFLQERGMVIRSRSRPGFKQVKHTFVYK